MEGGDKRYGRKERSAGWDGKAGENEIGRNERSKELPGGQYLGSKGDKLMRCLGLCRVSSLATQKSEPQERTQKPCWAGLACIPTPFISALFETGQKASTHQLAIGLACVSQLGNRIRGAVSTVVALLLQRTPSLTPLDGIDPSIHVTHMAHQ